MKQHLYQYIVSKYWYIKGIFGGICLVLPKLRCEDQHLLYFCAFNTALAWGYFHSCPKTGTRRKMSNIVLSNVYSSILKLTYIHSVGLCVSLIHVERKKIDLKSSQHRSVMTNNRCPLWLHEASHKCCSQYRPQT